MPTRPNPNTKPNQLCRTVFAGLTRGEGLLQRAFSRYTPFRGAVQGTRKGAIVSTADGKVCVCVRVCVCCTLHCSSFIRTLSSCHIAAVQLIHPPIHPPTHPPTHQATTYALDDLSSRGVFFVSPGEEVYAGMVVGEANRGENIDVNITREKKLTNVRWVVGGGCWGSGWLLRGQGGGGRDEQESVSYWSRLYMRRNQCALIHNAHRSAMITNRLSGRSRRTLRCL